MGRISRETARLLPVIAPVAVGGAAACATAVWSLAASKPDAAVLAGVLALAVAATLAEAFPVPIEGVPVGAASLANIFIVGAGVVYGWAAGVLVAVVAMIAVECIHRRPPATRIVYNSALYGVGAAVAGAAASVPGEGLASLVLAALFGSTAFYAANISLLALVIARTTRDSLVPLAVRYVRWTSVPFAIMASVTLMLVVLWERSPFLAAPLIGPLIAIALYQRSVHRALEAMRLARTDPLTGLGNHRHFTERLETACESARSAGTPLTVCLLDVDDFKAINDVYGHPMGDRLLAEVAARLRQDGEAFRVGGDEFALLLPGCDTDAGVDVGRKVIDRVVRPEYEAGVTLGLSVGLATLPRHAVTQAELLRCADRALYQAKEEGKNRVAVHKPGFVELRELRRVADESDRAARLRAAASLAKAVDERDAYTGRHSFAVGELAGRLAARLGLDPAEVELTRLAGRLHDLGKLAIPEEILRKPGPLTPEERSVLERHSQIGFRMLDSLGIEPVASWVLHHHERWDGRGYPSRLAGADIPLGARIIFVADAFDAMTSDRVYRPGMLRELAIAELRRCAGTQFDPEVVAAFSAEVEAAPQLASTTA